MKVLILGCGWVGTIFAEKLIHSGHEVYATTTSSAKKDSLDKKKIISYLINFNDSPKSPDDDFPTFFDLILISVPAAKKEVLTRCLSKFKQLSHFLQHIQHRCVIYLSSTGIYPYTDYLINEDNVPTTQLDNKLYQVEQYLKSTLTDLNILRLGGIFGYDRIPGKHFSGKVCAVANQLANYIHADDICHILLTIEQKNIKRQLFNAVSPKHPKKEDIILKMSNKYKFVRPSAFQDTKDSEKMVSPKKLCDTLDYHFLYPDPLEY